MRSNIVSEAGLPTRLSQWWEGIPFLTSAVVIVCGIIYLVCLLVGYDSFIEICFLPSAVVFQFQVYRIYTSVLFHGSLLHVMFNMMALVPLGTELERIMGSVRLLYVMILLATSNALLHLFIALLVAHNPFHPYPYFMNECGIGFSGILFSMIVIETTLSGVQSRSVFGLFNVPAKWYAWILLVVFQLLMTNISLLGHLCGILSGFAYTYGLFNYLLPGPSFYSSIESSSWLSSCVRRPKFILCTGGNPSGYIPTHSSPNTTSSLLSGSMWRNISSWIPQRQTSTQGARVQMFSMAIFQCWLMLESICGCFSPTYMDLRPSFSRLLSVEQDQRFPGTGRTLGSSRNQAVSTMNSDSSLQARLLDNSSLDHPSDVAESGLGQRISDGRRSAVDSVTAVGGGHTPTQGLVTFDEEVQKLAAMGFEKTQAEVALAAADGDMNVAVEILMSQQS